MANLDKDQVIAEFTKAYTQANGKAPSIEAKSGWYSVDGGKNVRLAQLQEMTADLSGKKKETAKSEPVKAKSETKSAKSNEKKSPEAKATKSNAKSGFSVKAFYAEQLKNKAPGATLPR